MAAPKYALGSALKIPGGFMGRVTEVYDDLKDAFARDPDLKEFGAEAVIRGKGKGPPSSEVQYFYRCERSGAGHAFVVGELDAHLVAQPPAPAAPPA